MGFELDYIFRPRSVAVAGASSSPDKQGHNYFKNLLEDFSGTAYPINFRAEEVLGVPTYKSVRDLPESVDYVISAIPSRDIIDLVDACASRGVKVLHLFTARFSETGYEQEAELERELLQHAKAAGIRILGPNCMGIYCPKEGISFGRGFPKEPGNVSIISQSGGNASEMVSSGSARGLRFSKVVSYGNALDLNEADLMEYLAEDPETDVIGAYIEGVRDGPRFARALRHAAERKPVAVLKGGRTQAGTHMVSSHTASLAGGRELWQAVCRQAGAVNTFSLEGLMDMLVAFTFMPSTNGFRVIVGGGSGGRSVLSADECEEEGLSLPPIPRDVSDALTRLDPFFGPWVTNPVDGSIMGGSGLKAHEVIGLIARSPAYDVVINNIGSGGPGGGDPRQQSRVSRVVEHTAEFARETGKPVAVVVADSVPENERQLESAQELRARCIEERLAVFPSVGRASRALHGLAAYYRYRNGLDDD
jgi:acyl-CoA synthetase (NDP forming)